MLIAHSVARISMAVLAVAALASGSPGSAEANASGAANAPATRPVEPPGGYDLGRIAGVADQLPPGFTVTQQPRTTFTKEQADKAARLLAQIPITVDPPQCKKVLQTGTTVVGTTFQGFVARGPQEITVIAAQYPQVIPDIVVDAECSHVTLTSGDNARGTVDSIAGPAIADADTAAVKMHIDFTMPGSSKSIDRLSYVAVISDKTAITVDGVSDPDLLADLLVKAVAAVRQN